MQREDVRVNSFGDGTPLVALDTLVTHPVFVPLPIPPCGSIVAREIPLPTNNRRQDYVDPHGQLGQN